MIQFLEVLPRKRHSMVQRDLILYNLAKVGVEGSNPFARSIILTHVLQQSLRSDGIRNDCRGLCSAHKRAARQARDQTCQAVIACAVIG